MGDHHNPSRHYRQRHQPPQHQPHHQQPTHQQHQPRQQRQIDAARSSPAAPRASDERNTRPGGFRAPTALPTDDDAMSRWQSWNDPPEGSWSGGNREAGPRQRDVADEPTEYLPSAYHRQRDVADEPTEYLLPVFRKRAGARSPASSSPRAGRRLFRHRPSRRAAAVSGAALAVLLLCSLLSAFTTVVPAMRAYSLAKAGLTHLTNAEASAKLLAKNPLNAAAISQTTTELTAAHGFFARAYADLQAVPGITQAAPVAGSKLAGAMHLLPIAVEGTQAGIIGCGALSALVAALKDPLNPQSKGITPETMTSVQRDFQQVQSLFATMTHQISALTASDLSLDPRLGPAITTFRQKLPQIQQAIQNAGALITLAPTLLGIGKPANYLVEVMDSTELRPSGGFIGNFGTLTLDGGRMSSLHIEDVDLFDAQVTYGSQYIPIPPQYKWFTIINRWGFRDSNLEADFPTSAQYGERLYALEGGTDTFQGVIAITPWLIQNALKITGPVYVSQYNETVTPDNLVDKIHYYALGAGANGLPDTQYDPASQTSQRKRFTGFLFQDFLALIKQKQSTAMPLLIQLFTQSLHTKDVQIYFNAAQAESVLEQYHLAATVQAPQQGDSLFEVDANIGGNKANYFLTYTMSDQITIDTSGAATHHLDLHYTWPPNPQSLVLEYAAGIVGRYHAYSRVYLPPQATILSHSGWDGFDSSTAYKREVVGGVTYVYYGKSLDVDLTWKVPHAATYDANGWHYQFLLQKQSGITWQLNLQVTLPACGKISGVPTGWVATGPHTAGVKEPLLNDVTFGLNYAC